MAVHGVYKVIVAKFDANYDMELHIKEGESGMLASLKGLNFTRTFFNGTKFMTPKEKESHNFMFFSAQVDDCINLVPPGGYHVGGVEFGGTVIGDTLTGTIRFMNGLIASVHGTRIGGEPVMNSELREDGIVGINQKCTCKTIMCTNHGFCDNCLLFNSLFDPPPEAGLDKNTPAVCFASQGKNPPEK